MAPAADVLVDLALSRGALDRAAHRRAAPQLVETLLADPATRIAVIVGDTMEIVPDRSAAAGHALVLRAPVPADRDRLVLFLGEDRGVTPAGDGAVTAYAAVVEEVRTAGTGEWQTLRQAGLHLSDRDSGIFTTAQALANWHSTHPFCPRCGSPTAPQLAGWIRRCEREGSEHYPRTDPAVIMAVVDDDDRLLIGRGAHWPPGRFSVLAGFVEPGESFEAAVAREVAEEVGIAVTDVTYLGNQPWPFPSSEMVGFRARALGTRLVVDPEEIAEARWVTRSGYLASLRSGAVVPPGGISIAQRLIEHWLGQPVAAVLR